MSRSVAVALAAALAAFATGCTPDYSPNTYAGNAVQQANKVEPAVVIGFRQVQISANGTVGAVSGGAAGGILGAQADQSGISSALGGVGGAIIGSLVGTGLEHAAADTTGWEYIVRKPNGELLSVTQREKTPLPLGQKVLVITGNQARIVPDYSTPIAEPEKTPEKKPEAEKTPAAETKPASAAPPPEAAKPQAETAPAPPAAAVEPPPLPPSEQKRAEPATAPTPSDGELESTPPS